ncbi:MAG TPA: hypothetical protein VHX88_08085 [Solirubrobacteraceae bacterium]|nr:hypothetical protein [Solirubrobacteraceae bacterium]
MFPLAVSRPLIGVVVVLLSIGLFGLRLRLFGRPGEDSYQAPPMPRGDPAQRAADMRALVRDLNALRAREGKEPVPENDMVQELRRRPELEAQIRARLRTGA